MGILELTTALALAAGPEALYARAPLVDLRRTPDPDSAVACRLPAGVAAVERGRTKDVVLVEADAPQAGGRCAGWVALSELGGKPGEAPAELPRAYVTVSLANVRDRPETTSVVRCQAPIGEPLTVLESQADWSYVQSSTCAGWISATVVGGVAPTPEGLEKAYADLKAAQAKKKRLTNKDKEALCGAAERLALIRPTERAGLPALAQVCAEAGYPEGAALMASRAEAIACLRAGAALPLAWTRATADLEVGGAPVQPLPAASRVRVVKVEGGRAEVCGQEPLLVHGQVAPEALVRDPLAGPVVVLKAYEGSNGTAEAELRFVDAGGEVPGQLGKENSTVWTSLGGSARELEALRAVQQSAWYAGRKAFEPALAQLTQAARRVPDAQVTTGFARAGAECFPHEPGQVVEFAHYAFGPVPLLALPFDGAPEVARVPADGSVVVVDAVPLQSPPWARVRAGERVGYLSPRALDLCGPPVDQACVGD